MIIIGLISRIICSTDATSNKRTSERSCFPGDGGNFGRGELVDNMAVRVAELKNSPFPGCRRTPFARTNGCARASARAGRLALIQIYCHLRAGAGRSNTGIMLTQARGIYTKLEVICRGRARPLLHPPSWSPTPDQPSANYPLLPTHVFGRCPTPPVRRYIVCRTCARPCVSRNSLR